MSDPVPTEPRVDLYEMARTRRAALKVELHEADLLNDDAASRRLFRELQAWFGLDDVIVRTLRLKWREGP